MISQAQQTLDSPLYGARGPYYSIYLKRMGVKIYTENQQQDYTTIVLCGRVINRLQIRYYYDL